MTSSNGNIFRVTGPLCGELTSHQWIPLIKTSDAELWFFSLIYAWTNGWTKNRDSGDLRRHRDQYDVRAIYHSNLIIRYRCSIKSIKIFVSVMLQRNGYHHSGHKTKFPLPFNWMHFTVSVFTGNYLTKHWWKILYFCISRQLFSSDFPLKTRRRMNA